MRDVYRHLICSIGSAFPTPDFSQFFPSEIQSYEKWLATPEGIESKFYKRKAPAIELLEPFDRLLTIFVVKLVLLKEGLKGLSQRGAVPAAPRFL